MSIKPNWAQSTDTYIWMFNVGRGLAVFIRTPNNWGILYDLGTDTDVFSPLAFIKENILPYLDKYDEEHLLAQLIVSHPHHDHISEVDILADLLKEKELSVGLLTCPHDHTDAADHEKFDFSRIEETDKIEAYRSLYSNRSLPLQTILFNDVLTTVRKPEYGLYFIHPETVEDLHGKNDHAYGNGCSIVLYYKFGENSILIPGDITPEALGHILNEDDGSEKRYSRYSASDADKNWHVESSDQPSLKEKLQEGLSILVAPHHGLESGYSEALYQEIKNNKPGLVLISEKRHTGENDGEVDSRYQCEDGAEGQWINIENELELHYSVSTRKGHHILIKFTSSGHRYVYCRANPEDLLTL